jgi:hypothetical protein
MDSQLRRLKNKKRTSQSIVRKRRRCRRWVLKLNTEVLRGRQRRGEQRAKAETKGKKKAKSEENQKKKGPGERMTKQAPQRHSRPSHSIRTAQAYH